MTIGGRGVLLLSLYTLGTFAQCPNNKAPKQDANGNDLTCDATHPCPSGSTCTRISTRVSKCCPTAPGKGKGKGNNNDSNENENNDNQNSCKQFISHGDPALHQKFGPDWASAYMAVDGRQDMEAASQFAQKYAEVSEGPLLDQVAKLGYVEAQHEMYFDRVHPRTPYPKDTSQSVMKGDWRPKDSAEQGFVDGIAKILADFNTTYGNAFGTTNSLNTKLRSMARDAGVQGNTFDIANYRTQIEAQVSFLRKQQASSTFAPPTDANPVEPTISCDDSQCTTAGGASEDSLTIGDGGAPCKGDVCAQGIQVGGQQCTSSSCFSFTSDSVPPVEDYDLLTWGVWDWRRRSPDGKSSGSYSFVTSVKDQNACGSCWDFASTAAFESAIAQQYGLYLKTAWVTGTSNTYTPMDLSEQQVLDHANGGCGGSSAKDACQNVFMKTGVVPNSLLDYNAHGYDQTCIDSLSPCTKNGQVLKQTFASVPHSAFNPKASGFAEYYNGGAPYTEAQIRSHLENEGPFAINLLANFGNWNGIGVYDNPSCYKNYSRDACNTTSHPEWCGGDLGINHCVLLAGYGSQLVNTCVQYNVTQFCIFGDWFCFPIRTNCIQYGPQPVNYWIVKNSWSWRFWAYHENATTGNTGGGYIKMRSGTNLCHMEEYLFKALPQSVEQTGTTSIDLPFGIHFDFPTFGARDICFNTDNTAKISLSGTDYEVKYNQADCYSYLCNYNRTKIEGGLVNGPGGTKVPNVGSMLPWYDQANWLGWNTLGRNGSNHNTPIIPGAWCENNLHSPNGFCNTATPYCSYGTAADGHKAGDPVAEGDVDPNSMLQAMRAIFGAIFGAEPYSATAVCQLWRDLCAKKYFWWPLVPFNLTAIEFPSELVPPKRLVQVSNTPRPTPRPTPKSNPTPRPCPAKTRTCSDGSVVIADPASCQFPDCPPSCPGGQSPFQNDDGSYRSCQFTNGRNTCPASFSCQLTDTNQQLCCPCPPCTQCPPSATCQCGQCITSPTPAPLLCPGRTPSAISMMGQAMTCRASSDCPTNSQCQFDTTGQAQICCPCSPCPNCGPGYNCVCGQCVPAPTPAVTCPSGATPLTGANGGPWYCSPGGSSPCPGDSSCQAINSNPAIFSTVGFNNGVCCPCPPCPRCPFQQICQCGQCVQAPTPSVVCPDGNSPMSNTAGGFMSCNAGLTLNFATAFPQSSCPSQSSCQRLSTGSYCCPCPACPPCAFNEACQCGQCVQAPTPSVVCPGGQKPIQGPNGPQTCSSMIFLAMMVRPGVASGSCPDGSSCQQVGAQSICCPCPPCNCRLGQTCQCGQCIQAPTMPPVQAPTSLPPSSRNTLFTTPILKMNPNLISLIRSPTPPPTFRLT